MGKGSGVRLTLHRDQSGPDYTLGVFSAGKLELQSIERPWIASPTGKGGTKGISCVPRGLYKLRTHTTELHPRTWALVNPDLDVLHWPDENHPFARTAVLIHVANYASELRGCIGLGLYRTHSMSTRADRWMVSQSKAAVGALMALVTWTDDHTLEIA